MIKNGRKIKHIKSSGIKSVDNPNPERSIETERYIRVAYVSGKEETQKRFSHSLLTEEGVLNSEIPTKCRLGTFGYYL